MRKLKWKDILKIAICFLAILSTIYAIYKFNVKYVSDIGINKYELKVIERVIVKEDKISYLVKLNSDKFLLNIYASKYSTEKIDLSKYASYKYGDIISVNGKILIPEKLNNPYEFNYKQYLNSKNICGLINTYSKLKYIENNGEGIYKWIYDLRGYICNLIEKSCKQDNAEVLKAIIYGDKRNIDEDTKEKFDDIGLSYMLVASGANIAIVIVITRKICKKLKVPKVVINVLLLVYIFIFMAICNFEISITRSGIMGIISVLLKSKNKKMSSYKKLLIAFSIMYILNPMCIYSVSFKLSFLAIFSIALLYNRIYLRLDYYIKNRVNKRMYKLLKYPSKVISIIISVQIGIFPIQISTFNTYSFISIFSSLFLGLFLSIVRNLGIIAIFFCIVPQISQVIFSVLDPVITLILKVLTVLDKISLKVTFASLPNSIILTYYMYLILMYMYNHVVIKEYNLSILFGKIIKKIKGIVIIFLLVLIILNRIYNIFFDNYLIFFNVGQGDMSYISYKGKNIVIDAGSTSEGLAENILLNYLKKKNIYKIDLIIISHFDSDHVNGIVKILDEIEVTNVIYSLPLKESDEYINILSSIKKKNINGIIGEREEKFNLENIQVEIFSPPKEKIKDGDEQNSNSIVCIIKIKDKKILYTGDATIETEEDLLNNNIVSKVDILKVGHHGSKTSTGELFIKTIRPEIAIISSKKKVYGHPSKIVLDILKKYNIRSYITEQKGAIKILI